jgi:hypothetical protein
MNAGLPGTGLGGLFYIASALAMPFHRARSGAGHDGRSWRRVVAQAGIALGILLALWGTGLGLGWLLSGPMQGAAGSPSGNGAGVGSVVRWILVVGTLGLLVALLSVVEVASAVLRMRRRSVVRGIDLVPLRSSRRRRDVLRRPWNTRRAAPASTLPEDSSEMALPESA